MNWDAIGAIGEIIGAISVLATLVYLAQQIRQSNKIAIASSEISIRENFGAINSAIYDNEDIAELFVKGEDPDYQFGKADHLRLRVLLVQLVNVWLSIEAAYENGMASNASFENIFDDVTAVTSGWPATKPIFLKIVEGYPSHSKTRLFEALRSL